MMDARQSVERLRNEIPRWLAPLRELDYPTALSRSITLSTFHGCPADEIERICTFLLAELDVHVIVKMNPPMLGREKLEHLLYDVLGYTDIRVNEKAYTSGLQFSESLEICARLAKLAASRGLKFGAKFSNTLEVENHRAFFQPTEKIMYLSGAPLHVITLTLASEFRRAMGADFPISFSAGVDRKNFAHMVACGFVPVTTCTDLLKTGGYGRLPPYLHELQQQMTRAGARTVDDFILDARGQREAARGVAVQAGFLNTPLIVAETQADPRYRAAQNRAVPKKIDSHLTTFDCITCDKCIPVCPNDANFLYHSGEVRIAYRDIEVRPDGRIVPVGEEKIFALEKADQIANFADYCNYCGNCDTFCPEYDGPYLKKPNFFGSRAAFDAAAPRDGFLLELSPDSTALRCRIQEQIYTLLQLADGRYRYNDGEITVNVNSDDLAASTVELSAPDARIIDVGRFLAIRTLLHGIIDAGRVHAVNTPLLAQVPSAPVE
jgi:putative selenate reductase